MHDVVCMRCGEDVEILYRSQNPHWADWDLCEICVQECDAEMEKQKNKKKKEPPAD